MSPQSSPQQNFLNSFLKYWMYHSRIKPKAPLNKNNTNPLQVIHNNIKRQVKPQKSKESSEVVEDSSSKSIVSQSSAFWPFTKSFQQNNFLSHIVSQQSQRSVKQEQKSVKIGQKSIKQQKLQREQEERQIENQQVEQQIESDNFISDPTQKVFKSLRKQYGNDEYEIDEIVLAKCVGEPLWPGRIIKKQIIEGLIPESVIYTVKFINQSTQCMINKNNIIMFNQVTMQQLRKVTKNKKLLRAIKMGQKYYQQQLQNQQQEESQQQEQFKNGQKLNKKQKINIEKQNQYEKQIKQQENELKSKNVDEVQNMEHIELTISSIEVNQQNNNKKEVVQDKENEVNKKKQIKIIRREQQTNDNKTKQKMHQNKEVIMNQITQNRQNQDQSSISANQKGFYYVKNQQIKQKIQLNQQNNQNNQNKQKQPINDKNDYSEKMNKNKNKQTQNKKIKTFKPIIVSKHKVIQINLKSINQTQTSSNQISSNKVSSHKVSSHKVSSNQISSNKVSVQQQTQIHIKPNLINQQINTNNLNTKQINTNKSNTKQINTNKLNTKNVKKQNKTSHDKMNQIQNPLVKQINKHNLQNNGQKLLNKQNNNQIILQNQQNNAVKPYPKPKPINLVIQTPKVDQKFYYLNKIILRIKQDSDQIYLQNQNNQKSLYHKQYKQYEGSYDQQQQDEWKDKQTNQNDQTVFEQAHYPTNQIYCKNNTNITNNQYQETHKQLKITHIVPNKIHKLNQIHLKPKKQSIYKNKQVINNCKLSPINHQKSKPKSKSPIHKLNHLTQQTHLSNNSKSKKSKSITNDNKVSTNGFKIKVNTRYISPQDQSLLQEKSKAYQKNQDQAKRKCEKAKPKINN